MGAVGPLDEARRATHRTKGPNGRVHAAWNGFAGAFKKVGIKRHGGNHLQNLKKENRLDRGEGQRGAMALTTVRAATSTSLASKRPLISASASAPAAATGAALCGVMPPMATTVARRPACLPASHRRRAWRMVSSGTTGAWGLVGEGYTAPSPTLQAPASSAMRTRSRSP